MINQRLTESSFALTREVAELYQRNGLSPAANSVSLSGFKKLSQSRSGLLLEAACKVAHASFGGVGCLSSAGELVDNPAWGVSDAVASELSESRWLQSLIHAALQSSEPKRLECLTSGCPFGEPPAGVPALGSLLIFPLGGPGRLRGALYLARLPSQPAFGPEDEEAVAPISACMGQGNLVEEASLQAQLRLLNRVAQAAAGSLEMSAIFETSLRELDRHLPMCLSAIWLAEGDPVVLQLAAVSSGHGSHAADLGLIPQTRLPLAQTPFALSWRDRATGIYTDWQTKNGSAALPCFATPLRAGNRIVGILQSVCSGPTGFKSNQVQLLYLVADLVGPAISNCQLFDRLRVTYEELRTTQAQLIRNEKLRAIGELASGVAHDFNNALCGVLGFVEIAMMDKLLSPSTRANLELASTCALDAAKTVHRIQDFARVRPKDNAFLPVDLGALVKDTIDLTRPKWECLERSRAKPINLHIDLADGSIVLGNLVELREVLTNVLFNAVDAMPEGGTLTARTWSEADTVCLSVADTGVGMPPAVQQRLFEPFFTTKGERGNGMGLSVAFGIVKHHGGDIAVASEVGRGSTFTIRLPSASPKSAEAPAQVANPGDTPAAVAPAPAPLHVLVVDDEEAVRHFLSTVLTKLGHRPYVTRNGGEAMEAFSQEHFDVVLTDMGMPGMSGQEIARRIADHSPNTPVILLTGWADQLKSEGKALPGVTRILGKPVTMQHLAETLSAVCPG